MLGDDGVHGDRFRIFPRDVDEGHFLVERNLAGNLLIRKRDGRQLLFFESWAEVNSTRTERSPEPTMSPQKTVKLVPPSAYVGSRSAPAPDTPAARANFSVRFCA